MSRHRFVRALDADEEYDGYYACYGHSVEDDFCISPQTEAQFLYDRSGQMHSMGSFVDSHEPVPEEDDETFDSLPSNSDLSDVDLAKLRSCIEAMQDVVGDTIVESVLRKAAIECMFNFEKALQTVLDEGTASSRKMKSGPSNIDSDARAFVQSSSEILSEKECKSKPEAGAKEKKFNTPISTASNVLTKSLELKKMDSLKVENSAKEKAGSANASPSLGKKNFKNSDDSKTPNTRPVKADKSGKEIYLSERKNDKPLINLVVIGHVDAGKSTLMGHLLYRLGNISQRNMHKFEKDSKKIGKGSFMYAWVLDETPEERNRGITMDVAQSNFETPNKSVVLLDAPGHKDFIPNMITGAVQADVAILVIDATRGEFETGFETGGQTREHTMLIRSLGVSELAVVINKMDNVDFSEERFVDITRKMSVFLKQVGFKESDVIFVPCSGLSGENLVEKPQELNFKNWYNGPTLIEVIDQRFRPPERLVDKPLRMCVSDVFKGTTGGLSASGKIATGILKSGDKILVMPGSEQAVIRGISTEERTLNYGFAGDQVTLQLQGIDVNNISSRSMICSIDDPIKVSQRFEARIVIFSISFPITKGFPVILHYQSLSEQAVIRKLKSQLNRNTGEILKGKPRCLTKNSSAIVEIEVSRPICVELFSEYKDLGRFMLRSGGSTIAAGLVSGIK